MDEKRILKIKSGLEKFDFAILTGASSGIGAAFLDILKTCSKMKIFTLSRTPPKNVNLNDVFVECDLSREDETEKAALGILDEIRKTPDARILLINNAGFGAYGEFPMPSLQRNLQMVDLNARAVVQLCGIFGDDIRRGRGGIINIASTAAWQPCPQLSVYAATKTFVLSFSLALSAEMKGSGAQCLCVCPGPTSSNFFRAAGFDTPPLPSGFGHVSRDVAIVAMLAFVRGKKLEVVGKINKIQTFFAKILPTFFVLKVSYAILKRIRKIP